MRAMVGAARLAAVHTVALPDELRGHCTLIMDRATQAVARKYLGSTQYQLVDEPTMTLNQFWVPLIGSPAVLLALIVWVVWRRKIRGISS